MINILDVIIIFLILFCALLGLKRGAIKSSVSFIGTILIVILAYFLKNPIANFLMTHLPFFDFGGLFKGVSVLNVLIYEAIAFLIVFSFLQVILRLIINFTSILEGVLNATIILGIPSKILGCIFGFLEGYIYAFALLFILSLFSFSVEYTYNSKLYEPILNHTPILTNFANKTSNSMQEIYSLKDKYKTSSKDAYNYEAIEILLKNKVVTTDTIKKLIEQDKLAINNIDVLLNKY